MTPSPKSVAGAKGGRSRSEAKLAALDAMHAARRGVPVHPPPPPALAALIRLHRRGVRLHGPWRNPWSLAKIAREVGVDGRTFRRWVRGEDRPAEEYHPALEAAAESLSSGS